MTNTNLEEKISFFNQLKSNLKNKVLAYVTILAISSTFDCEVEYTKPSEECCQEKQCSSKQNTPVCDGKNDDCYCRAKTCCEEIKCEESFLICEEGDIHCYCREPFEHSKIACCMEIHCPLGNAQNSLEIVIANFKIKPG
ncbi:hypothetical protein HZC32_02740 [Candidatus Woesearchaeota archaeon]|nr:hypothetical protein [Candidatus Woesearchaeota archaeon]